MIEQQTRNIKIIPAESTYKIRQKILRPGRSVSSCYFPNDFTPDATHLGVYRNNVIVGVLSVYHVHVSEENFAWQLRAMATVPWVRGLGYGRQLLQAAESHVRKQSGNLIWCNARINAAGFYQKAGFQMCGGRFFIRQAGEHILMKKNLSQ